MLRYYIRKVFKKILKLTASETKKKAIKESRRYILNQWDGIEIKADKGFEIIGCSAEGHVSHILSDRLSSRPKSWSEIGVKKMAELRIYIKNGGSEPFTIKGNHMVQWIKRQS